MGIPRGNGKERESKSYSCRPLVNITHANFGVDRTRADVCGIQVAAAYYAIRRIFLCELYFGSSIFRGFAYICINVFEYKEICLS